MLSLGYFVLLGGGTLGELWPVPRLVNAFIGAAALLVYVWRAPLHSDRLDKLVLVSVLLFASAGVTSSFPRQSLDATLGALTLAAGLFVARGVLAGTRWRLVFVRALMGLSLVLTTVTVMRWLPPIGDAIAVRGGLPPLTLDLPAVPWGYRYDLALALALLYPAWWIGRPSAFRQVLRILIGLAVIGAVLISGSRTLWAALLIATVSLAWPAVHRYWHVVRRYWVPAVAIVTIVGVLAAITGLGSAFVGRLSSGESLGMRWAMWGPLAAQWLADPVDGLGPGSFPWALQLTSYFESNVWPPRHPDNAVVQVAVEGGLLGLAAVAVLAIAVLPAVMRGTSAAARWSAVAFVVACLGGNPSEFVFVVVIALSWVAYAVPRADIAAAAEPTPSQSIRRVSVRSVTLAALAICMVGSAATQMGGFSYETARAAVAADRLDEARLHLDTAIAWDPGMALYVRQRGILRYLQDDHRGAINDLEYATTLNAADDLAWRSLAVAYMADGQADAARSAARTAVSRHRSNPTNLLLMAELDRRSGQREEALSLLGEAVQSWPAIVAAPGWSAQLPPGVSTLDVVDAAVQRWERGLSPLEPSLDQPLWLAAMSGRADLVERAIRDASVPASIARTTIAVTQCDPSATAELDAAPAEDRAHPLYLALRAKADSLTTEDFGRDMDEGPSKTLNPLDENGILSADAWGYRRYPITWPPARVALPSPTEGIHRWNASPRAAAQAAGLVDRLPLCQ